MSTEKTLFAFHGKSIMSDLNKDRSGDDTFCDVTLQVDGVQFKAHKNILAKVSKYFYFMFKSDMKEKYESFADIKGITSTTMEIILEFIYSSEVTFSSNNFEQILAAAHYFQLHELLKLCSDYLISTINFENYLHIYRIGSSYSMNILMRTAESFIENNFVEITDHKNFTGLDKENVLQILHLSDQLSTVSIAAAFEGIVAWIKHDLVNRKQHLSEMMKTIKLYLLPRDYLEDVVMKEEFVKELNVTQSLKDGFYLQPLLEPGKPKHQFVVISETKINLFKVLSREWRELPNLPRDGTNAGVVAHDDRLYIVCGQSKDVLRLNLYEENADWTVDGQLPEVLQEPKAVCFQGDVLLFGENGQAYKYDITNKSAASCPYHSFQSSAVSKDGRVLYVTDGDNILSYTNGTWSTVTSEVPSRNSRGVIMKKEILCLHSQSYPDIRAFSLTHKAWRKIVKHKCRYEVFDALAIDDTVYVFGREKGYSSTPKPFVLQRYNSILDDWSRIYSSTNVHSATQFGSPSTLSVFQTSSKLSVTAI